MALQFLSLNFETTMTKSVELLKKHKAPAVKYHLFSSYPFQVTQYSQTSMRKPPNIFNLRITLI